MLSIITIEYDVRDDQPEETEVFRLEPATNELIEKVLCNRYKFISQIDARTIAQFSGGNARIAIALASTLKCGENLGDLKDSELFKRLFQQRNESSSQLLEAAKVCSLVYSFNIEIDDGKTCLVD